MKILLIGGGSMGQAFITGLVASPENHQIVVVEKSPDNARLCEAAGVNVIETLDNLDSETQSSDVCIIAVKPKDVPALTADIARYIDSHCVVVSIAAGISIATLRDELGAFPVVRAMPNIAASQLLSATAMASVNIMEEDEEKARNILESVGTVVRVNEEQMNLVTAVSGSGPAYYFLLSQYITEIAEELGLDVEVAHQLVMQTFVGAAALANDNGSFASLREQVTSPGGTTAAAIEEFESRDLNGLIKAGLVAALSRGVELDANNPS